VIIDSTTPTADQVLQCDSGTGEWTAKTLTTGAVVGTTDTQTLTNKTIDSTTNTVTADKLHSATTTIDIVSAAAPASGQVLMATASTTATCRYQYRF